MFFSLLNISKAQYFETGQDPASIKWRQINTENFQIIYPDYYEAQAQKLALIMEKVYGYSYNSLKHHPKKISIILHTQTVQSNGLVAWAPKRSEFYTTPHQRIYAQDWLQQLAIHEFRHVVQIDKVNSELPKIIKILLGEQGTAGVFGIYFPWWFIEGDAVVTETALSNSGRGRFPSFLMEHKAQVVENGIYKYDKAYNGSVKDFVPDHYKLGYYLVGSTREKYGTQIWDSVVDRVGKKPFSLNPFNKALKQNTGFTKVKLYESVFDSLQNDWKSQDNKFQSVPPKVRSPEKKWYTNYKYNHWLNDSAIVSYKTSLNETSSFVLIDNSRKERQIIKPGIIFDESINYRGDWIVWNEQIPDLRWSHSGKSVIRLYNIETSKKHKIIPEFMAFAPAISPNMNSVAVVEIDFSSNYYLSVYRIVDGKLLNRIQTKNNNYFFSPEWLNEKELVAIVLFEEGKRLAKFNLETKKMDLLIQEDLGEIKSLEVVNNQIYFTGSYTGKNGIFVLNLSKNSIQQIYEPRFGSDYAAISPNDSNVIFSDYTADGFRIIELPASESSWRPLNEIPKHKYKLADTLAKQESGVLDLYDLGTKNYKSKRYSKAAHAFNFHSWAPVSIDPDSYEITPGVSFLSQNKLGTSFTTLGYEWDVTEKTGKVYGKYTFKGWYPIFDVELNTGNRASEYMLIEQQKDKDGMVVQQDTSLQRFTWKQTNLELDARIPFNFSRGKFYRLLQPEISYDFSFYRHDDSTPDQFFDGNFQTLIYRLYYQQVLWQSSMDVYPNFGFTVDASYRHSPFGDIELGNMVLGQSYLFVPGVLSNHGIRLYAGYQEKNPADDHSFSDVIKYPRGWGKINSNKMQSYAIDYKMPLFYPEWSIGGLAYLKRVEASLFADYAYLEGNYYKDGHVAGTYTSDISSYGIELTGDMHFLRFYAPVEIGTRMSYLPETGRVYFDFLFSIDFNSL
jgi:hypothetical protein